MEQLEGSHAAGGTSAATTILENYLQSPLKLHICMPPDPADPLLGKCQQKCIRYVHLKAWIKMFIATFLYENYAKARQGLKSVDE